MLFYLQFTWKHKSKYYYWKLTKPRILVSKIMHFILFFGSPEGTKYDSADIIDEWKDFIGTYHCTSACGWTPDSKVSKYFAKLYNIVTHAFSISYLKAKVGLRISFAKKVLKITQFIILKFWFRAIDLDIESYFAPLLSENISFQWSSNHSSKIAAY